MGLNQGTDSLRASKQLHTVQTQMHGTMFISKHIIFITITAHDIF